MGSEAEQSEAERILLQNSKKSFKNQKILLSIFQHSENPKKFRNIFSLLSMAPSQSDGQAKLVQIY
jgi:hypothetical protein